MFALGLVSWMYTRPTEPTLEWIRAKFAKLPLVVDANIAAFKAGHAFGETAELFDHPYEVAAADKAPGTYTNINGNTALCRGARGGRSAVESSGVPRLVSDHPGVGHPSRAVEAQELRDPNASGRGRDRRHRIGARRGVRRAISPSRPRAVPVSPSKGETLGLAVSLELPLIIVDIQRGGPSTGLPTKTEAADLLMAMYGRHGESPMPIVAAYTPAQCFHAAIEAARIALEVPDAGDVAVRRLSGERHRAMESPGRELLARHLDQLRRRTQRRERRRRSRFIIPMPAIPRPSPVSGRCRGPLDSCTGSAASRRKT